MGLDARAYPPAVLSLAGGLAAARAVRTWVTGPAADRVSVKWPNDVVAGCPRGSCTLKIAGVLVEVRDGQAGRVGQAGPDRIGIFLATAHPAKFSEVVEPVLGRPVEMPAALAEVVSRPRHVLKINATFEAVRRTLAE